MAETLTNGEVILTYAELAARVKSLEETIKFEDRVIRDLENELVEGGASWVSMVN